MMVDSEESQSQNTQKLPLIIGISGLLNKNESGRVEDILNILKPQGYITQGVFCSSIERRGLEITCNLSLDTYAQDIFEVYQKAIQNPEVDQNNIGFIASSMGAAALTRLLSTPKGHDLSEKIRSYASIAPFVKLNENLINPIKYHISNGLNLDIGTSHDKSQGWKRVIAAPYVQNVLEVDAIKDLKVFESERHRFPTLTILGKNDDRVDVPSIRKYHEVLRGAPEDLLEFDCKHDIPYEDSKKAVVDFYSREFPKSITRNAAAA